jgi:hypothetical protein
MRGSELKKVETAALTFGVYSPLYTRCDVTPIQANVLLCSDLVGGAMVAYKALAFRSKPNLIMRVTRTGRHKWRARETVCSQSNESRLF